MSSQANAGNTTADGSEQVLDQRASDGVYQFVVSTANLANGDVVEFKIKTKPRDAAGSVQIAYYACYAHAQSVPLKLSVPVAGSSVDTTLKQTAGTYRAFEWSVRRLDA
jgi:hypothetical protein